MQFRDGGGQRRGGVRGDGRCSGMRLRLFRGGGSRLSEGAGYGGWRGMMVQRCMAELAMEVRR